MRWRMISFAMAILYNEAFAFTDQRIHLCLLQIYPLLLVVAVVPLVLAGPVIPQRRLVGSQPNKE